jgi:hypothetical protein
MSVPAWLRPRRLDAAALGLAALFGLADLAYPYNGDQALFALGAQKMFHGAALYRDFWDLKQPAIYLFYLSGGALFGFGEIGLHLFELGYWLLFGALLAVALRGAFRDVRLASAVPFLVVAGYYAGNGPPQLTQVEALAGFPLFVFTAAAVAIRRGREPRRTLYAVAGLAAGVTLLWKLLFIGIIAAIVLALAFHAKARATQRPPHDAAACAAAALAGFTAPLLAFAAYTLANHEGALVLETFFVIPAKIAATIPAGSPERLLWSARWFEHMYLALIVLGALGLARSPGDRGGAWRTALGAWIAGAAFVIAAQRQSWWDYHFDLFLVPLGILGAFGIDALLQGVTVPARPSRLAAGLLIALAVLFLAARPLASAGRNLGLLERNGFAREPAQRLRYQYAASEQSAEGIDAAAYLNAPGRMAGEIYVAGDPTVYIYSGRQQAVALNGWSLEFFVGDQWHELYRELAAAAPPYVFVGEVYRTLLPEKSPEIARLLATRYRIGWREHLGAWYAAVHPALATQPRRVAISVRPAS